MPSPIQLLQQTISPFSAWVDNKNIDLLQLNYDFQLTDRGLIDFTNSTQKNWLDIGYLNTKTSIRQGDCFIVFESGKIGDSKLLDGDWIVFNRDCLITEISPASFEIVNNNYKSMLRRVLRLYSSIAGLTRVASSGGDWLKPSDYDQVDSVEDSNHVHIGVREEGAYLSFFGRGITPPYRIKYFYRLDGYSLNADLSIDVDEMVLLDLINLHIDYANQKVASAGVITGINFNEIGGDASILREQIKSVLENITDRNTISTIVKT